MRLLFPAGLLCTLQVCSHLGETSAKPLTSLVELSIRREFSADGLPFMSVRDVVLTDRESFPLTDYQPNSTTVTVLDHLLAMHRQKRETSIYMKRKELSKRQTFGGRTKQCEKKKKYKLCDGIYKMFWNALTKTCETCEAGKEPTSKGDKCVEPETPEQEKERGKCPLGKKLDPNVPGQVSATLALIAFESMHERVAYINLGPQYLKPKVCRQRWGAEPLPRGSVRVYANKRKTRQVRS